MRLLKINLLVAALMVFGAATSSAYRVDFATAAFGTTINQNDLISIDVVLDTEGQGDITLVGVGVLFDEAVFTYRQDLSSVTSYLLYTGAKAPYLIADPSCGGYPSTGACGIYPTRTNQVQVGFLSSGLPAGAPGATPPGGSVLTTLVFEAVGNGVGSFAFDFDSFYGSILQLGDLTNPPLGLGASGVVTVPEPTTALLVGLGLVGLGVAGRRSRK